MAEERLIDEDKDRKYRIRINEDGEEELVIVDPDDAVAEEEEIPVFDVPVYEQDDEEAAVLTPEQLAERNRLREEEERSRAEKLDKLVAETRARLDEGDFEAAQYAAGKAELISPENGEVCFLKLKALSRNLTEFNNLEQCAAAADGVRSFTAENMKAELKALSGVLKTRIAEAEENTADLRERNEAGKQERRAEFMRRRKNALTQLIACAAPFLALLIATIALSTMMFSAENGAFLIATIAVGALAFIAFICTLVAANKYWSAVRNVRLNETDGATKLGREYTASNTELELLKRIYGSFNNDIS